MLFIFMGSSCSGKSTVADELNKLIKSEVVSGKDYLRLAKNEDEAWNIFYNSMLKASFEKSICEESIIYIISETEVLPKIKNIDKAITVKFAAEMDVIKSRFSKRIKGKISQPIEKMLEKQDKAFKDIESTLYVDTTDKNPKEIALTIVDYAVNS